MNFSDNQYTTFVRLSFCCSSFTETSFDTLHTSFCAIYGLSGIMFKACLKDEKDLICCLWWCFFDSFLNLGRVVEKMMIPHKRMLDKTDIIKSKLGGMYAHQKVLHYK